MPHTDFRKKHYQEIIQYLSNFIDYFRNIPTKINNFFLYFRNLYNAQQTISELQVENEMLRTQNKSLESQIPNDQNPFTIDVVLEMANLERVNKELNKTIHKLTAELNTQKNTPPLSNPFENHTSTQPERIIALESELSILMEDKRQLLQQIQDILNENSKLESILKEQEDLLNKSAHQATKSSSLVLLKEQQISQLENRIKDLLVEIQILNTLNDSLKANNDSLNQLIQELTENDSSARVVPELQESLKQINLTKTFLVSENARLKADLSALQSENEKYKDQDQRKLAPSNPQELLGQRKENAKLSGDNTRLQGENGSLKQIIINIKQTIDQMYEASSQKNKWTNLLNLFKDKLIISFFSEINKPLILPKSPNSSRKPESLAQQANSNDPGESTSSGARTPSLRRRLSTTLRRNKSTILR